MTQNDHEVVVVSAADEYHRLTRETKPATDAELSEEFTNPRMDFKEFLLSAPYFDLLDVTRVNDRPRDVDLSA